MSSCVVMAWVVVTKQVFCNSWKLVYSIEYVADWMSPNSWPVVQQRSVLAAVFSPTVRESPPSQRPLSGRFSTLVIKMIIVSLQDVRGSERETCTRGSEWSCRVPLVTDWVKTTKSLYIQCDFPTSTSPDCISSIVLLICFCAVHFFSSSYPAKQPPISLPWTASFLYIVPLPSRFWKQADLFRQRGHPTHLVSYHRFESISFLYILATWSTHRT